MGKIKARGQFHQIKNEDTGASSTDSQDYTDHTVQSFFSRSSALKGGQGFLVIGDLAKNKLVIRWFGPLKVDYLVTSK